MKRIVLIASGAVFAGLLLVSTTGVYAAYDSSAYARDYKRCLEAPSNAAVAECQKNATIRFECAKTSNVHDCYSKKNPALLDELEQGDTAELIWAASVVKRRAYGMGNWKVIKSNPDPIDDSVIVHVFLRSSSYHASDGNEKASLVLRCSGNETEMYIDWSGHGTGSATVTVTHRFDKEKPITAEWTSSTDKNAFFYYGHGYKIAKKLMTTDDFVARWATNKKNPATAIFDTRGLSMAIEPLREACSW